MRKSPRRFARPGLALVLLTALALAFTPGVRVMAETGAPKGQEGILYPDGTVHAHQLPPPGPERPAGRTIPRLFSDPDLMEQHKDAHRREAPPSPTAPGGAPLLAPSLAPSLGTNFKGLQLSQSGGFIPPDTQVAAGPSHVFEAVNLEGRIFNKTGAPLNTFTLNSFFGLPSSTSTSDPKIRFDPQSGRWFVALISIESPAGHWRLAVSKSSDPTGAFVLYSIASKTGTFPDFPALGINDDKVVLTANAFTLSGFFQGTEFTVLNKAQLLAGGSVAATFFPPPQGLFTIQPAHSLSSTTTLFMAAVPFGTATSIRIWSVTGVPGVGPGVSFTTVSRTIASLSTPPDAVQQGTTRLIQTNDNSLLDAVYRNGSLWVAANAACLPSGDSKTRACLRFIEFLTATKTVHQDFNFGTVGTYYYYAAIQTDSGSNLVAVFSRSSALEFASVYRSGRLTTDPLNTLQAPAVIKVGENAYQPFADRWGDYSGAAIDPSDQTKVWVAGEYARIEGGSEWGTWIAQVGF